LDLPVELADTSVWARKRHPAINPWFDAALAAGQIAVCDMVALELLHSASTRAIYRQMEGALEAMPWLQMGRLEWLRAREVYRMLSRAGHAAQRAVKHADLLIAAAAEVAGLTLVHYDRDYDAIASVTGQPVRWVRPRGSIA
jgi:predicted nucleic acid-binding protein